VTDKAKDRPDPNADAAAERLARLERVLWSTVLAADVEPWVTPQWKPADARRNGDHARR
jgi:hypothetical protein